MMGVRLLVAALAACLCQHVTAYSETTFTADNTFLQKQKNLFELFWHVDQPTIYHPELHQIAKSWNIIDHVDDYTNKEVAHDFLKLWKLGMTPRGELFSPWYADIQPEIVALFDLFYFAKDYETFYNTAVWARFNVNEQMYNYLLALTIIHRPDTKHIRLPNLYEVVPHYFFNEDVIERAQRIKMGDVGAAKKAVTGNEPYILHANYSGWYLTHDHDTEWKLNYFTEDIGMNTYYFYQNAMFPYWLSSEKYNLLKDVRGQMYYFNHKHLLARYYLERLSNDMGELEWLDWDKPIVTGYYPTLVHPTGLPFPQRPTWSYVPVHKYEQVERIRHLESRIMNSIDNGRVEKHHNKPYELYENTMLDMNHLGNIIQGNGDSFCRRYYGSVDKYARNILGFGHERSTKHQPIIGSLDMTATSMRDPGFYRMYKKILNFFIRYKTNLPKYTHEELVFPGVKIESVAVDKLVTYFDNFETMINNAVAVKSHKEAQSIIIKARQQRLNHKPFTYHLTVNSDKATKAWIHIYLGPKFDVHGHEIEMIDNWMNFFEMDYWIADLKAGMNKIERSSHESLFVVPDTMSSIDFYKMITKALEGGETYKYSDQMFGIPDRMMLPKGKPEGMQFKLFVYVSPHVESETATVEFPVFGTKHFERNRIGFPLDRPMYHYDKTVPNMYWKDVTIFHKNVEELNVTV